MKYEGRWLEGTNPAAIFDEGYCRDCTWRTAYSSKSGEWKSKTLAKIKNHVRSTGHRVEYRQTRFSLVRVPDDPAEGAGATSTAPEDALDPNDFDDYLFGH